MRLDISRIEAAVGMIDPVFLHSPQYVCESLSHALGCRIVLKVETMNPIRCFKGRGIETALAGIVSSGDATAVVCASAGNLGQALAYSGRRRGLGVTVTASSKASPSKIARMKALGATVVLVDGAIEEALAAAADISARTGAVLIEDSRNIGTCEGAGTIGLELAAFGPPLDAVLISLGAGAMATGIGAAMTHRLPATEVLTVQPEAAPAMTLSFRAGHVVDVGPPGTIADGVAGRYVLPEVLDDLREVADDALLVSEDSIRDGMRLLYRCSGLIVEPAAALGIAAILENRERFAGRTVATVLCGGNIATADFEIIVR
ncbi:threonine ammonia-lyase [Methylobrevis pamukkalensis]|uniref:Phenylserine dehydratase n=1 Tax=Methylobrevis pamukkalensis TaxID=1439726 RepID=A0A1E3H2B4_9HYPH|nr:pyridoxal-phosphate dependent enzyme [Methylobrevis pamukkalensis]ODN70440.1 Phenylserine dehydratase [Methylobrevis pamukkalensis]